MSPFTIDDLVRDSELAPKTSSSFTQNLESQHALPDPLRVGSVENCVDYLSFAKSIKKENSKAQVGLKRDSW